MTVKSALSVVALTVAFAGSAFAQGMTINGVVVPEDELAAVEERCLQLSNAEETESLTETEDDATDADDANDEEVGTNETTGGNDALTENAPNVNEVEDATTVIDLDTITLQACIDGGFVTD